MCSNPIHVYQLIKATKSLNWKDVTEIDVLGSINALTQIQSTYQLPIEDLIIGQIGQRKTHGFLDAQDCLIIAKQLSNFSTPKLYANAIEWAENALLLDPNRQEIRDFLVQMKDFHDDNFMFPTNENGQFFIRKFNGSDITAKQLRKLEENQEIFQRKFPSNEFNQKDIHQLCRGKKLSKFVGYCEYRTNEDPWLLLLPLKAEILAEKPFPLVIFHGLISNTEILKLKDLAQKDMGRSAVHSEKKFTFQRIQSSAWLWDPDHDFLQILSKRLDHVLQLSVSNPFYTIHPSEPYQIGVYPPGGYYGYHYDVLEPLSSEEFWIGNRMATLMFYVILQFDDLKKSLKVVKMYWILPI